MERVRTPDANFPFLLRTLAFVLPIGFGFLMIPFAVLPILAEAALGPRSPVTDGLHVVSPYALKFLTYAFVITYLGMYGLRGYVAMKLRRQKRTSSGKG
jgi:hypothetical protein